MFLDNIVSTTSFESLSNVTWVKSLWIISHIASLIANASPSMMHGQPNL
jgi:hypothetical protein